MGIHPTKLIRQLALLAVAVNLGNQQPESFGQDLEYRTPRPLVRITIDNPEKIPLQLHQVDGETTACIAELSGQRIEQCRLESGFYFLTAAAPVARGFRRPAVAIPAWVPAMDPTSSGQGGDSEYQLRVSIPSARAERPGLCWIPAGPTLIGDRLGVGQPDERPARIVEVEGFWLGAWEVSNQEYVEFLNGIERIEEDWLDLDNRNCRIKKQDQRHVSDAPLLPVVTVTYAGAEAYCRWKTAQTGNRYRLPTEIEWEKGARGPESFTYAYGNVYHPDKANQESGQPVPVGRFAPNAYQLHDMTGNVFEWVLLEKTEGDAAVVPKPWPQIYTHRLRGGSFVLDGMYLRNSFRMLQNPRVMADDIGFRVLVEETGADDQ